MSRNEDFSYNMIVTATQGMIESVDEFLAYYSSSRFSKRTVELYGMILNRFLEFMRENVIEPEITRNDARLFLAGVSETNNPISTNQYLAVMRIFFNWMITRGLYTGSNNFADIPNAKEPDLLPVFLIANERARLYQLVEEDPKIKVKDVIMLDVFIGTGVRTTELCNLRATDFFIHDTHGFFRLRVTKGSIEREIIMPEFTRDQVIKLIHMNSLP